MKKKLFIIPLILTIILTACSKPADNTEPTTDGRIDKSYNFIFVCPATGSEYWQQCIEGIKQADKELGTSTVVTGEEIVKSFETETTAHMEYAIKQNPDAIVTYAGMYNMHSLIKKATDKGIPVMALDADASGTSRIAYVGTNSYRAGYYIAEEIAKLAGENSKVGILVSSESAEKEMNIVSAFKDTVHDYNIDVVAIEETAFKVENAEEKARIILSKHPDITALIGTSGYNTMGAARTKRALGRDDLIVVGIDDFKENVDFVRDGVINALLVQDIKQAGYRSIYLMKEYLDKGFLSKTNYYTDITMVTKDNVDNYSSLSNSTTDVNKKVRVGYYKGDLIMQNGFSDSERKSGYAYEYYQAIATIAGWDYEYVYGTREKILDLIKKGEVDIAAGIYKTDTLKGKVLFSDSDMGLDGTKQYFAVNKNRPDLLDDLNKTMKQIAQSTPDFEISLLKKYYKQASVQVLNQNELEWLSEKKELKIGYLSDNLPISDIDDDGEPTGVIKAMINVLQDYMNVKIVPVCYKSSNDMQKGLNNGNIDISFPVYLDVWNSEKNGMSQTDAFVNDRVMVVYKGDYSNDIFNKIALSKTNIGQKPYLGTYYPNAKITYYESIEKALDDVETDKQNCVVACSSVMQHKLRDNSTYQNLNVAYLDTSENFTMSVSKNDSMLLGILNKAIRNMDDAVVTSAMIRYSGASNDYSVSEFVRRNSVAFILVLLVFIALIALFFANYRRKSRLFNKRLEEANLELEDALDQANSANRAKTNFLSSMSHDIRTPMNAIIGMTSIAQKNINEKEKLEDCLDKINLSSHHLLTLINNILDISKIESGKLQLNPNAFSLKKAMNTLIEIAQPKVQQKQLEFITDIDSIKSDIVYADEVRINQIFMNILSNALKYTPNNGKVCMTLRQEELPQSNLVRLIYIVEDTGIGMSKEFMENMYDTFSRANDSRIDRIQGTGLGLSIVKQMVDMMYGTIDCESEIGKGTKFTVTLDVSTISIGKNQEEEVNQANDAEKDENSIINNTRILVAEDNELNWEVASELLGAYGITTERAENGRICIEKLTAAEPGTYNLILMDIQMPVMNGREATKIIRSDSRDYINKIPIIAMTADAFAEDIAASLNAGMDGHVSKPIDINKLFQEIAKAIHKSKNQ